MIPDLIELQSFFPKIYIPKTKYRLRLIEPAHTEVKKMLGIGSNMPLFIGSLCFGGGFMALFLLPLIINILIGYWMYKDAEKRNENGALWFVIGFFLTLLGLIIWLVVRPDMSEVRREEQRQQGYQQQQYQQPPNQQQGYQQQGQQGQQQYQQQQDQDNRNNPPQR